MKRTLAYYFHPNAAGTEKSEKPSTSNAPPTTVNESDIAPTTVNKSDLAPTTVNKSDISPITVNKSDISPITVNKSVRHYNKQWEKKYSWLEYNEEEGGAFCKLCKNFMKNDQNVLQKTGGIFITVPFVSYKKALGKNGKLEKHEHSSSHTVSVEMEKLRLQAMKKPIHAQIVQQSESEKNLNRKCLKIMLRGLYFLIKEEVAHTTKYGSLVEHILDKLNDDFRLWRETQSERSNYSSKDTACELLLCISEVLRNEMKERLKNKYFSLLADESTSIRNEMELSIILRVVEDKVPVEKFLTIVKIPDGKTETIADAIDKELKAFDLKYDNIVAFGFDGASNMSGNIGGVRKKLSNIANRDILYIHCKAHILSLAVASCRNKNLNVKRFFHVLKDIYKLFNKSPKKENILHEIQAILNDPILKIPECVEVRWFSHYKIVNAVLRSYKSIMMACEHIHKEGADLASLAGGILLEMRNQSFFITCFLMNELLSALSNLSNVLQKKDLTLSKVIPLLTSTKLHLMDIAEQCGNNSSVLQNNVKCEIENIFTYEMPITVNECAAETYKGLKKYCEHINQEMDNRFNDQSIDVMNFSTHFETFQSLLDLQDSEIRKFCKHFQMLNVEGVLADLKSFRFFIKSVLTSGTHQPTENPYCKIMDTDIGYSELRKLCEILLAIPVTTASVERSFSTMNRILNKARNRMLHGTLMDCMIISIEGPESPSEEFLDKVVDIYAMKKIRRIRFL